MPRMLRDIIDATVRSQPDMELVDRDDAMDLELAVRRCCVDVAIVGGGTAFPERLFFAYPKLKVMFVTADGRAAELLELRRRSLVEPSQQNLVDVIHAALSGDDW